MEEYKGIMIEPFMGAGYTIFYCGEELYFDTVEDAKKFIDEEILL